MEPFEEDWMDSTDDDSFVLVDANSDSDGVLALSSNDSEGDFAFAGTDSEGYFALANTDTEGDYSPANTDSEGSEDSNMVLDEKFCMDKEGPMRKRFGVVRLIVDGSNYVLPAHIKSKEDVEIKDVVKDHVLAFLPAKSLVKFRTVSKDWDRWIVHPFLAHKQSYLYRDVCGFFCQSGTRAPTFLTLDRSVCGIPSPSLEFLPEPVVVRSSCNGLLLCQGCNRENKYYVCNPVIKEWKVIPEPMYYHGFEPAIVLVFEPSEINIAADFQVICAIRLPDLPILYFEIYSSQENSWRLSAAQCFELETSELKNGGFYMKGFVYWATSCGKILAFDMKNEFYGVMPLPPSTAQKGVLTQMHGELCYVHAYMQTGKCTMNIYSGINMDLKLTIEFGDVERTAIECQALPCVNSDLVMILIGSSVYSYHVRDYKVRVVRKRGNDRQSCYLPYVNSLVRLLPDPSLSDNGSH